MSREKERDGIPHFCRIKPHITNTARVNPIQNVKQIQLNRSEILSKDMQVPSFTIYTWRQRNTLRQDKKKLESKDIKSKSRPETIRRHRQQIVK